MPTVFTHPVVALALSPWMQFKEKFKLILFTGVVLCILPDIDVIGLRFGIPYDHWLGHRGITHSVSFAILSSGIACWLIVRNTSLNAYLVWGYLFLCAISHGMLDAFTYGGGGVAFFAPFTNERYFFPFRPIEVSTLSIKRFFSGGYTVLLNEFKVVWLPFLAITLAGYLWSRKRRLADIKLDSNTMAKESEG